MKNTFFFLLFTSLTALCLSFMNKDGFPPSANAKNFIEPDTVFLADAASSSMMEIQLGTLAQQKAASADVKRFGQMMIRDHTQATQELKSVAAQLNFIPKDTMLPKHSRHVGHLDGLNGAAFDRAYITMMIEAHKDDIDEFEDAAKKAAHDSVKRFAARQLPILIMHRDTAAAIGKRLR